MRILNVTQSYAPFFEFGGPPVKVRALAEGLARRGHQVSVLTTDWGLERRFEKTPKEAPASEGPYGRAREIGGVAVVYLAKWLHYRAASWNPGLRKYLRAELKNFDVAHIFGLYDLLGPGTAAECRKHGIPYVIEPIGMYLPIVRNLWLKRIYHRFLGREMVEGASLVVATAEQERRELVSGGIAKEKILLRRNGVDSPSVLPERGSFREEFEIPANAKLVLFLGRLSEKKSPDLLLKAFAGATGPGPGRGRRADLAFVGPDETGMKARLRKMAKSLGLGERVHFSDALEGEAKWQAYRDADIFVLPSQNENFGNTAAEAVAAGTPVIVTDQCGIAPLLEDVAGMVVKHDEKDLRGALARLLEDNGLRTKLKDGCKIAYHRLDWEEPLAEMEAAYQSLAARGGT
ncbi:MAG TPA: glycosyltransferase [Candidatus Acidoferrum sp.]|nr:glycosyltransferase [Candidatus Acidoferrum sp.]